MFNKKRDKNLVVDREVVVGQYIEKERDEIIWIKMKLTLK